MEDESKEELKRRLIALTALINGRWARHSRYYNLRDRRDHVFPSDCGYGHGHRKRNELFDEEVLKAFEEIIIILEDKGRFMLTELPRLSDVLSQRLEYFYFKIGLPQARDWYKRVFDRSVGDERISLIVRGQNCRW